MLASYGVALYPLTRTAVVEYLATFSGGSIAATDQLSIEAAYRAKFDELLRTTGKNGLQIVDWAHREHPGAAFDRARSVAETRYVGDGASLADLLEGGSGEDVAVLTVNRGSALLNHVNSHAVMLGYDGGWFAYDVNTGALVADVPQLAALGDLGDGLLITQR
jgi:hypothetical protein